jgi:glycine/D-amino acid oxidase-like deaminating enzyme
MRRAGCCAGRATIKHNLRTGRPVWTAFRQQRVAGTRLERSTRAEVAVVGGGISGALIAHALTDAGIRPLILDRRRHAMLGSTPASTALLQFELDTPLTKLSQRIGRRAAERAWRSSREAVNELRTRAHRLGILAQMTSRPSLYVAGDALDRSGLQRELRARQRIGLPCEFLDRSELRHHFGIDRPAAILSHGNAEANPVQLASGFLRAAIAHGARFHAPHEVMDLRSGSRGITLLLDDGLEVLARRVILCTGYEMPKIVPETGNHVVSTWVIATHPQAQRLWPQQALIWEASETYLYVRTTADGRVICGGEDELFSDHHQRDTLRKAKTSAIRRKLADLLPRVDTRPAYAWTGCFGAGPNGMPTIGEIPGFPRCYAAMGYGGNGITFSMLAATLLSSAVAGRRHPDAKLFAFR